jgi:hypothetical protein
MSNGITDLYQVIDEKDVVIFKQKANELILDGFEPLGSLATHQVGQNVTFFQAFWRPEAIEKFNGG